VPTSGMFVRGKKGFVLRIKGILSFGGVKIRLTCPLEVLFRLLLA
jgi:hypothetical protein